jgi:hypothetical protein
MTTTSETGQPLRLRREPSRWCRARAALTVESLECRLLLSAMELENKLAVPASVASPVAAAIEVSNSWVISSSMAALSSAPGNQAGSQVAPDSKGVDAETGSRRDLLENAEVLANLPWIEIDGSLATGDTIDLYVIPTDPSTVALQITLKAVPPSSDLPSRIWLLDQAGRRVGDWYTPSHTHEFTLDLQALNQPLGSSIVFGISHEEASLSDGSSANYKLSIIRQNASTDQSPAMATLIVALAPPVLGMPLLLGDRPGAQPSDTNVPAISAGTAAPGGPGLASALVATGLLPTRSAGSTGGWFTESQTGPPINSIEAAMVDSRWIDSLPQRSPIGEHSIQVDDPDTEPRGSPELVALESPGGFPLLAAALHEGHRRARPALMAALLPGTSNAVDPDELTAAAVPMEGSHPAGPVVLIAGGPKGDKNEGLSRRRGSLIAGLNVVATLAFGLLLPDLVAAFQSVEPRRHSRWKRSKFSPRFEPSPHT